MISIKLGKSLDAVNRETIIILMITVLGLFLRLTFLDLKSVWLDEAASFCFAKESPLDLPRLLGSTDNHPPLYYLILHFFLQYGSNEFILRLSSIIAGTLTIPVVYLLGKKLFSPLIGLLSSTLMTLSPMHIYYSQEARMYPLFTLLTVSSIYFFIDFSNRKPNCKSWIGYVGLATLSLYTHYFGLLLLGLSLVYVVFIYVWKKLFIKNILSYGAAFLTVLLVFSPWMPYMMRQPRLSEIGIDLNLHAVNSLLWKYGVLFNDISLFWSSHHPTIGSPTFTVLLRSLILMIFLTLSFKGVLACLKRKRQNGLLPILLIILSIFTLSAAFLCGIKVWHSKYFTYLIPFYLITVSMGAMEMKNRIVAFLMLTLILMTCAYSIFYNYGREVEDWRSTVEFV